jgi:hypothetical protein
VREYEDIREKYVVIDSAEKLSDIERPEVFQEFLTTLRSGGWKLVFTTRLSYLDDLKNAFIQVYNVAFEPLNIPNLRSEDLCKLSVTYKFALPKNARLLELLQNPFYLNEYFLTYPNGEATVSYADFKEAVWNKQIVRSSYRKGNTHRTREECFLEIAHKRANSGRFFVSAEGSKYALQQLEHDEIIKFDANAGGYFITHDIYEEWALDKMIERTFGGSEDYGKFYKKIGSSLAMRRSFRSWLSEKLSSNDSSAAALIEATIDSDCIERHWKDEVIIAALLSNHAKRFVDHFDRKLLEGLENVVEPGRASATITSVRVYYRYERSLLYKVLFLLRLACKEADQDFLNLLGVSHWDNDALRMLITKPKGSGWSSVIGFINAHKEELGIRYMRFILPVLDDWNRYHKRGETTKDASQIALFYFNELTKEDGHLPYGSRDDTKVQLVRTIFSGSAEIGEELKALFTEVISKKNTGHRGRYYEIVRAALSALTESAEVAKNLPTEVIGLATLFWFATPSKTSGLHSDYRNDIEQYFGLAENHSDYYPASAFQTPIFALLQAAPLETIDFILAFTNKTIEYFAKSEFARYEIKEVELFIGTTTPIKQHISHRIWNIYRGTQVAPTVLESVHMALERWLLMHAREASSEVMESWCLYLIKNSRSASITAVVASVVLAEPIKLYNVAQILLRAKDLFFFDTGRVQLDMNAQNAYTICHDPGGLFKNERLKTCEDKHRSMSLEHLAFHYQLFKSEGEDEEEPKRRQEGVWKILDDHYAQLPGKAEETETDKTWRLYLARMDGRKMKIVSENRADRVFISFDPDIDPELKRYSETSQAKTLDAMRYTPLQLWARYKFERKENKYRDYPQYETDFQRVIAETKEVVQGLQDDESDDRTFTLFYRGVPSYACSVLIRDHFDQLDGEGREFCKDVILNYASGWMQDGYAYQIGDGVEVAINALPLLLRPFPEERKKIKETLLLGLFDSHPMGMSERFSDYAVGAIGKNLWREHAADANSLFVGYLLLKPKFDVLCESMLKENHKKQIYNFSHTMAMRQFIVEHEFEIEKIVGNKITYEEISPLIKFDVEALVTAFLLLPSETGDKTHKDFACGISQIIATKMCWREDEERFDYLVRHRFLEQFEYFVLQASKQDISKYIAPFLEEFKNLREAAKIFSAFISAEDVLGQYEQFWTVWEMFYPEIRELCKNSSLRSQPSRIVHNCLLAWAYWKKDAKEWHSLRERDKIFFKRVAENIGDHPAVLYSLSKLLNEIGETS